MNSLIVDNFNKTKKNYNGSTKCISNKFNHLTNKFKSLVDMLNIEFGFDARLLSKSEIYSQICSGCKGIIIKTPFNDFSLQIITNLDEIMSINYITQSYVIGDEFLFFVPKYESILDTKIFNKYFTSCDILSIRINEFQWIINLILINIVKSHTINEFYNLLKFYSKKNGFNNSQDDKRIFEQISKRHNSINNYNQNIYLQIYKEFQNAISSLHCLIFNIVPIKNIILSYFIIQ